MFGLGETCNKRDCSGSSTAPTCKGGKWHPDALTRTGCSNDEPPESWDDATLATVMYDSAADCCQVHHSGWTCAVRHKCKTGVEYLKVTARPTEVPTMRPSSEPTPPPTLSPIIIPTYSPTSVWYVDHFTGVCHHTATSGVVMPQYIEYTFGEARECCENSFNSEKCMDALPEEALVDEEKSGPTSSPVPTPSPKYYVDQFSQTCIAADRETMPHWIRDEDTFNDPAECCKSVPAWWQEQCLEKTKALMDEGESEPTSSPVPTPSPKYFVDRFSQTCITAGSETMPHWIRVEDKFDDPAECCKSLPAWWEEQCLEKSVQLTPYPTYSPTQFVSGVSRISFPPQKTLFSYNYCIPNPNPHSLRRT